MPDTILKRWNGTAFEELYPKTTVGQISASGTASSSTFLRGDGQWAVPAGVDGYLNTTGDTSTGMQIFSTALTNNDDWLNSPVSIRERGLVGAGTGADNESPNLNFHWSTRQSRSLWFGADGRLNWGEYSTSGVPAADGIFRTGSFQSTVATGTAPLTVTSTTRVSNLNVATAGTADTLTTGRTIGIGTGAVGTATSFNGSTNITIPITGVSESYLTWGGKHLSGQVTPVGMSLSNELSANRIAFINGNGLDFEYSSDSGTTWTNYNYTATQKSQFCTTALGVPIGRISGEYFTTSRTRVTLTAQNGTTGYVYTNPRKMLINVASSGGMNVLVETRTGVNFQSSGAWSTVGTYSVSGWSGWNDIPLVLGTLGGGTTQTGNNWQLRLTFIMTSKNTTYPTTAEVTSIRIFGENAWQTPSTLAATNDLYSFDMSQNANFPGTIQGTRLLSTIATGTAPLSVTSTTVVTNLNADLLDGNHSSAFALASHTHDLLSERATITYGLSGLQWNDTSGVGGTGLNGAAPNNPTNEWWHHLIMNHANAAGYYVDIAAAFHTDDLYLRRNVGGTLSSWRKIWNEGNDGTGSNLDADLLDGNHASAFLLNSAVKEQLKYLYIYGKAESAITKGQAVQFAGVQGDHILMKPAVSSEINTNPNYFMGIAETTLATNDFGYVLTNGELVNVNTNSYTAGDILWFASAGSTAGAITNVEPTGTNAKIQVAAVTKVNATEGIIYVRVHAIGTEVEDIVAGGTASSSTFLRGDGQWATPPGGSGGSGDVVGPATATNNNIAVFDGTTGKLIKDGGNTIAGITYTHPTDGANSTISNVNGLVLSSITVNTLGHVTAVGSKTLAAADIPTLNQDTTGSAATLTTARTLTLGSTGKTFNGSADVSWSLAEIGAQAAGSYAASSHTHAISNVTDLQTSLDGKVGTSDSRLTDARTPTAHTHPISDITDLQTTLNAKATPSDITTAINNLVNSAPGALDTLDELAAALGDDANFATTVTNALAGKAATSHTHTKSQITDFAHTHTISNVTNLQTELDGKAATSHTHTKSEITDFAHTHVATDISNSGNVGRNLLTTSSATASTLFFKKNPDHTITLETGANFLTSIGASPTAGSTSITTLGTVSTGTWSASTIAVNKGGTGTTSLTSGSLLVGAGTGAVTTVAPKDLTALGQLAAGGTAPTTERAVYYGTHQREIGVSAAIANSTTFTTITFTSGMRDFWLYIHQDSTTGSVIARIPLTITSAQSIGTATPGKQHRVAWSNGTVTQVMNVDIFFSGTTMSFRHNFTGASLAFRWFGY